MPRKYSFTGKVALRKIKVNASLPRDGRQNLRVLG